MESKRLEDEWLRNEVLQPILEDMMNVLKDCRRHFTLLSSAQSDDCFAHSDKFVLTNTQGGNNLKAIVTLLGCDILEGEFVVRMTHPNQSTHIYKTSIKPDIPWRLQQLQDAGNFVQKAINSMELLCESKEEVSNKHDVQLVLGEVSYALLNAKNVLTIPKKKSNEELIRNKSHISLRPSLPAEMPLSIYIHDHKLVCAVYQFHVNSTNVNKSTVLQRYQVECTIPWLRNAIHLLLYGMQLCHDMCHKFLFLSNSKSLTSELL